MISKCEAVIAGLNSITHLPKPSSNVLAGFDWSIIDGYEMIREGKLSSIQNDSGCIGCMFMLCIDFTETHSEPTLVGVLSLEPTP